MVNRVIKYVDEDGRPTLAWQAEDKAVLDRLVAVEAKLAAIAALSDPSGVTTDEDVEARASIAEIIDAAS